MKKIALSVVMSMLLLVGSLSIISMAPPPPNNTRCQELYDRAVDLGVIDNYDLSKGEFISLCNVCLNKSESAGNTAVCICKQADAVGLLRLNMGQCVNLVKSGYEEE